MKKLLLLIVAMLLCCIPAFAEPVTRITPVPQSLEGLTLRPSADEVKVYATPSMKANIVGYIIVGGRQEVNVLSRQADWYYVSFTSIYGTSYGWIPASCFQQTVTPTPSPTPSPTPIVSCEAFVCNPQKGYRLNLRSQPSSDATSLGKYYTGTPVTLLGELRSGYAKVRIGTVTGWIDTKYLTANPYGFVSELPVVTVNNPGGGLNLRYGPGTGYQKIGWYPHGAAITILGVREDEWYHVAVGGQTGFMSSTLMSQTFPWYFGTDSDTPAISDSIITSGTTVYISPAHIQGVLLHSSPSASSQSLGRFYGGCPVTIISYTRTGWAYVRIGGMQGYVDASALSAVQPIQTGQFRTVINPYGTGLNLRTAPSLNNSILQLCPNHTIITVLGDLNDGWCYVRLGTQSGYMMSERLR